MKKIIGRNRTLVMTAFVAVSLTGATVLIKSHALAEEISQSHMDAAKKTIDATRATERLNDILPATASNLLKQLITNRPDIDARITQMVNETALELASRRGDLEKEIEKIYTHVFSEKELLEIGRFFSNKTGQKFLVKLPVIVGEINKASRIWRVGISRDLNQKVQKKLSKTDK